MMPATTLVLPTLRVCPPMTRMGMRNQLLAVALSR
jgi:hypothetical protein